VKLFVDVTV